MGLPDYMALSMLTAARFVNIQGELVLVDSAEKVAQIVGSAPASPPVIAAATDTKVRNQHSFRLCESLFFGNVSFGGLDR